MTKPPGIGTYLAQGWAANAGLTYILLLGFVLLNPDRDDWPVFLVAVPIYSSLSGIFGAAVGVLIWMAGLLSGRKINVFYRAGGAILFPLLLTATVAALAGFLDNVIGWLWISVPLVVLVLPPALLSGSRYNPLKFALMNLDRDVPKIGWPRAMSIIILPLLRLISALGILESLLYLATLRSPDVAGWNTAENQFVGAVVAVVYFWTTLIVSLFPPERIIVLIIGVILNAPIVAFSLWAQRQSSFDYRSLAIVGWVLVSLWTLFTVSRCEGSARIFPVTMVEIRVRHAFDYW
jgi:hypothetical protein